MARTVITLMGDPIVTEEYLADEAITPGQLLEITATGVKKQTDDAAKVATMFALERDELGDEIGDAYTAGDTVKVGFFAPGMRVYAFLASGQDVAAGAYLSGDTGGLLEATTAPADILAQALEAVTASLPDTTGNRIRVQIV